MATLPKDELAQELERLAQERGPDKADKARRTFVEVTRWLRRHGHGDVTLSAIDHKLGTKLRIVNIVDIDRPGP